ncbi:hypothetical protein H6G97_40305 [Nostoc flagelliforme FACHB-838]|uniref:Transposase n=2 Tax=Nostoc flagelliforme TaxID=1306274 RepID=A0ABR8E138_9NOSO|nr:hypothetical protein [Nostoc flagelliforme FACHB-838]
MVKNYDKWQPKADRAYLQQEAVKRYILLKKLKPSELTLDDKLFIENFQSALHFWGSEKIDFYIKPFLKL